MLMTASSVSISTKMLRVLSLLLLLALVPTAESNPAMLLMAKRVAWKRADDTTKTGEGERPVVSISSVLRNPHQLPFNQLFFGSDWHGKVMNQIQGYNELFREMDTEARRKRRLPAASEVEEDDNNQQSMDVQF